MKADDRTMTLLTGVVLTIGVGTLAQNSDAIMEAFSGGPKLAAAADNFTVKAGKPQILDVLANDASAGVASEIRILAVPSCGVIESAGQSLKYTQSGACSGAQSFEYCLALDETCESAMVTLNVIGARVPRQPDPVIAEVRRVPPMTGQRQPSAAQIEPDKPRVTEAAPLGQEPEAVNDIRLAVLSALSRPVNTAALPEMIARPAPEALDAQSQPVPATPLTPVPPESEEVAQTEPTTGVTETRTPPPRTFRPVSPASSASMASVIDILPEPTFDQLILAGIDPEVSGTNRHSGVRDVPAMTVVARGSIPDFSTDSAAQIMLPTTQARVVNRASKSAHTIEVASLRTDTQFVAVVDAGAEQVQVPSAAVETAALTEARQPLPATSPPTDSPTATLCPMTVDLTVSAGATLNAAIVASCYPGERITIGHAGIRFAATTDASGRVLVKIPAITTDATVSVLFADGSRREAETTVPDMDQYMRVAVTWDGVAELDLHALEFGANTGELGHVWPGMPRSYRDARRFGGGYLTTLGLGSGNGPQAQIYTMPLLRRADRGLVEMSLALAGEAACNEDFRLRAVRSDTSHTATIRELRFNVADCDRRSEPVFIANALQDLRVASRR